MRDFTRVRRPREATLGFRVRHRELLGDMPANIASRPARSAAARSRKGVSSRSTRSARDRTRDSFAPARRRSQSHAHRAERIANQPQARVHQATMRRRLQDLLVVVGQERRCERVNLLGFDRAFDGDAGSRVSLLVGSPRHFERRNEPRARRRAATDRARLTSSTLKCNIRISMPSRYASRRRLHALTPVDADAYFARVRCATVDLREDLLCAM